MGITSLIKKRAVFLKTGDATKYLNIRGQEISGKAQNLTGDKVRDLAKTNKLKHYKTSTNENFLFKTSWLEQYLTSCYGDSYTGPEFKQERFSEFDTNANVPDKPVTRHTAQGLFTPQPKQDQPKQNVNAPPTDFLHRIKNSPPLIYLSALLLGFAGGTATNVADRLIGMGYFSDRISIADPIENDDREKLALALQSHGKDIVQEMIDDGRLPEYISIEGTINDDDARRLASAIQKQEYNTPMGRELRELQENREGPFEPVSKVLKVHLLDTTNNIFEPEYHNYVVNFAAVVCGSSDIAHSNITINASEIKLSDQTANGLVKFNAILTHPNVCTVEDKEEHLEVIVVNRQTFDDKFNIDTADKPYVVVKATIKHGC